MASPRYLRRVDEDEDYSTKRPSTTVGELRNATEEESLHVTGLREHRLIAMVIWLSVLCVLAAILLICNIMLIRTLQMSHHGMKSIRIHNYENLRTKEKESVVFMSAENIDLGHVIAKSGHVVGPRAQTINVDGTRVMMSGATNVTQFSLQDGLCKFDSQSNFKVINNRNEQTMFSAQHPMIDLDNRIRKISTGHIITNKIRAPVNQDLEIRGENVNLRGNEGIRAESRRFHVNASTALHIKTSADGAVRFNSRHLYVGAQSQPLPISSSPALTASVDAFRVCVCSTNRPKLFLVRGNKRCNAQSSVCK
ncbi:Beta-sarcoglycan [Aphelenchoides besseyi]|nr:Beta-sarcoglycan [Aphelenchoides besseyi]KAI6235170.1 Beta-sarcoglycan [Aphelenchoides besseyi]